MNEFRFLDVHPKLVLLSGKKVRADVTVGPVGIYDIIREDIRRISEVQPVDRIFMERATSGYRGVMFSKEVPYLFTLNGNGLLSKRTDDDTAVSLFCSKLEEAEQKATGTLDANRANAEQEEFNAEMADGSPDEPSFTAIAEDAPRETIEQHGPLRDFIDRSPHFNRIIPPEKKNEGVCGGAVVVHNGKVLLVKPRNGYGGYDWTFPKGYPTAFEKTTAQTAMRETKEETGYSVPVERFLGRFTHNDGGSCDYYYCNAESTPSQGSYDEFETEATRWATVVEALELLNDDVDIKILAHANNLVPQLIAKGGAHSGTMVALHLPMKVAKKLAVKGGEEPDTFHVTLAYLGKGLSESQKKACAGVVRDVAKRYASIKATLGGIGRFSASESSEGRDVVYISVDSPEIGALRASLVYQLFMIAGVKTSEAHGFIPHITLAYVDKKVKTPIERLEPIELTFDNIALTIADKQMAFPFKGKSLDARLPEIATGKIKYVDTIHGGKADAKRPSDFDAKQLAAGKRHEMEHTDDERIATEIAMDHLTEDRDYYKKLKKIEKALPRLSSDDREAKNAQVGAKTPAVATKTMGSGGQTRYNYPGEKGSDKPKGSKGGAVDAAKEAEAQQQAAANGGVMPQQKEVLPHPDLAPPEPDQDPIREHRPEDKPDPNDARGADPHKKPPGHTVNVQELCSALNIDRSVLMQIVKKMQTQFASKAREKFMSFMRTHLQEYAEEHGLDGDYFGLLYDVLIGGVPEGQPASAQQAELAKKAGKAV